MIINKGKQGDPGVGISSFTPITNDDGTVTIRVTFTDNSFQEFVSPTGEPGQGISSVSFTSTTAAEGIAGVSGETDTYTIWADEDETVSLGTFTVTNPETATPVVTLTNLGTGKQVFKEGTEFDFRTIDSDTLSTSILSDVIKIESDFRKGSEIISSSYSPLTYTMAAQLSTEPDYKIWTIHNDAPDLKKFQLPSGFSFINNDFSDSNNSVLMLPQSTLMFWIVGTVAYIKSIEGPKFNSVLPTSNNWVLDTPRGFISADVKRNVYITGHIRYDSATIDDVAAVGTVAQNFRPRQDHYFMAWGKASFGSPEFNNGMGNRQNFGVMMRVSSDGIISIAGINAPIANGPTAFGSGQDVRFIKSYIRSLRFSTSYPAFN